MFRLPPATPCPRLPRQRPVCGARRPARPCREVFYRLFYRLFVHLERLRNCAPEIGVQEVRVQISAARPKPSV